MSFYEHSEFPQDISKYEFLDKIGQGSFGVVFKGKLKTSTELVAIKTILRKDENEGFPISAIREIKQLKTLHHENIVHLIEICFRTTINKMSEFPKTNFYLVMEFCEYDLAELIENVRFTMGHIKNIIQQLLNALYYMHNNNVMHRDLKPANILVTKNGVLKLADFGLARTYKEPLTNPNCYTTNVVTLWYRPPELLLGECNYGPAIDMWCVGCIMAEMLIKCPIFPGNSEIEQLHNIISLCGSITPEVWPEVIKYELFNKLNLAKNQKRQVISGIKQLGNVNEMLALDLIYKLLVLDPKNRIDADAALNHDFFWTGSEPEDLKIMLSPYNGIVSSQQKEVIKKQKQKVLKKQKKEGIKKPKQVQKVKTKPFKLPLGVFPVRTY